MGSLYAVDNSSLQGLRKWAVKGFKKYLIFYLDQEDFITIVRILYTAQDIEKIIGSAFRLQTRTELTILSQIILGV
jgi:toxin ParE1/3/4